MNKKDSKVKAVGTTQKPSRARKLMGHITPKLAELTDDVLFGDVWARPGLSQRDRSLITVAALIALARTDQLASHMNRALDNGVTQEELAEVVTQLAFYDGWPPLWIVELLTVVLYVSAHALTKHPK
jgi:4-carboxymuconolactone decarboxylase